MQDGDERRVRECNVARADAKRPRLIGRLREGASASGQLRGVAMCDHAMAFRGECGPCKGGLWAKRVGGRLACLMARQASAADSLYERLMGSRIGYVE